MLPVLFTGDFVVGVTAVDRDAGRNGKVVYSLLNHDDRFVINNLTGVVTAAQRLSGQQGPYSLTVRASDMVSVCVMVVGEMSLHCVGVCLFTVRASDMVSV